VAVIGRRASVVLLAAAMGAQGATRAENSAGKATAVVGPRVYVQWQTFAVEDGLPDASIRTIHVSGDDVWVGTDSGLARWRDDRWRSWTADDGLPGAPIGAIDTDPRTGDVWLGTQGGGLIRFTAGRFDRFTQFNSGLAGDQVFAVAVAGGRVWAAGNGGISAFEPAGGSWDLYLEPRANMPETAVTSFSREPDALHAGTWCGPVLRFDAGEGDWSPLTPKGVKADDETHSCGLRCETGVAVAVAGQSLWWVTQEELLRRANGGRWEALRLPDGGTFVTGLVARNEGEAWVGTRTGLLALTDWRKETWVAYRRTEGASRGSVTLTRAGAVVDSRHVEATLPDNRIRCLAFQGDDLWVGTHAGLARGTGPVDWQALRGAQRPPGSTDSSDPCRRGGAPAVGQSTPVTIGVLHPLNRPISRPGTDSQLPDKAVDRRSVGRAVDRANGRRRARGQPEIALVEELYTFARYGWGTPQDTFSILRRRHDVRGFVGYLAPHARIDTAMALRTEVPVVNIAPTEPTIDERINPWVFRCGSNDPRRHRLLLDFVLDALGRSRPAVVQTPGFESRVHLDRWANRARERGHAPVADLAFDPDAADLELLLEELRRSGADVVLTWTDARTSAELLRGLRSAGLDQLFVGSDLILNRDFVGSAGPDPGQVIAFARCPHLDVADDVASTNQRDSRSLPGLQAGSSRHAERSLRAAAHLLAAIELAGPKPEAVRGALCEMSEVELAILEDGVWRRFAPEAP
jgi:ABC-type branched-subunit amino acid transport system substrate-binding protein